MGVGGESRLHRYLCCVQCCKVNGLCHCAGGLSLWMVGRGMGWVPGHTATATQLFVVMSAALFRMPGLCAPPHLLLLGSLKLWAQLPWLEAQNCRRLHCSLSSTYSVCSSPAIFSCTNVWKSLVSEWVGQRLLCLAVDGGCIKGERYR